MAGTFLVLLVGHLVGDFCLQNNTLVKARSKSTAFIALHAAIVTASTIVIAACISCVYLLPVYALVFLGHFLVDWVKKAAGNDGAYTFAIDQFLHIAVLAIIAGFYPYLNAKSLWLLLMPFDLYIKSLILLGGVIACVFAGSVLVSKSVKPLIDQIDDNRLSGLRNGGKYIGQLERALTFFFMLTAQTSAIGFLFAAKSILRFGEINEPQKRKEAEYIIIGTFLSFGWALLIAYLTVQALRLW